MVFFSGCSGGACSSRSAVHASSVPVPAVKIGDGVRYGKKKQNGVDLQRLHCVLDLLQKRTRNCNTGPQNVFKSIVMNAGWSGTVEELEKARLCRSAYTKLSPSSDPLKYKVGARPVNKRVKPTDLMNYVNRAGYQINLDEAKYLINLVDEDRCGSLGLKDFMQLFYCKTSKVLPACEDRLPSERPREVFNHVEDKKHLLGKAFLKVHPKRRYNITKADFDRAMSHALPQEPKLAEEMWCAATEGGRREVCDWRQFCQDVVDFDNSRFPSTPVNLESPRRVRQYFRASPKQLADVAVRRRSPSPKKRAPLHRAEPSTRRRADSADNGDFRPAVMLRAKSFTLHGNAWHKASSSALARPHSATPQRPARQEDSAPVPRSQSVILGATLPEKGNVRPQSATPYCARHPDSRKVSARKHAISRRGAPDYSLRGWAPEDRVPVKPLAWQRQPAIRADFGNFSQNRAECVSARLWPKAICTH